MITCYRCNREYVNGACGCRDGITLVHGDCREVLPQLESVDLVCTDPPYGVGFEYESYTDTLDAWKYLLDFLIPWCRANSKMTILPSCQINQLEWIYANHKPDWLICWYKGSPGHAAKIGFNDWEPLLVYGRPPQISMHDYFFAKPEQPNGHPCPKPVEFSKYLISRGSNEGDVVLDATCGSGTTLRAAKDLGRRCIGIEIEEKYCEIAAKRLQQEVLAFTD